jgi:hypothetical protein
VWGKEWGVGKIQCLPPPPLLDSNHIKNIT